MNQSTQSAGHWLREQLDLLDSLLLASESYNEGNSIDEWELARAFLAQLLLTARKISERDPVSACVVSESGVTVAAHGAVELAEPIAAVSYDCLATGQAAVDQLELGRLQQLLVSGEDRKLAIFRLGFMDVSILAPTDTHLASVLSTKGTNQA